ncbi:uncharacterized protein LOC142357237, partial [Convolutriloba macropyga]|uniref:uncharacterized protein LOC142357237 n=1 Tax=Convolutriloba macropyga TaxID=536237 RepID=UPI003F520D1B
MDSNRQQGSGPQSSSGNRHVNGGGGYAGRAGGGGGLHRSQSAGGQRHTGMVILGGAKNKPRGPAQPAGKLAVPRPVNLPSLRKEHGGNDPTTQLVAPGGTTGWNKPTDDPTAAAGGLNTLGPRPGSAPWQGVGQPGGPPLSDTMSGPNSRAFPPLDAKTARMSSSDYPTLGAGTKQSSEFPSSKITRSSTEPGRLWQDDERRPSRLAGSHWRDREDQEDERYVPSKLTEEMGRRHWDDDFMALPGMPGFGGRKSELSRPPQWDALAGALDAGDDDDLLPGSLASQQRHPPPPPPPKQSAKEAETFVDPEREAYLAELERLAADMDREKRAQQTPPETVTQAPVQPPPPPPQTQAPAMAEVEDKMAQQRITGRPISSYGAAASAGIPLRDPSQASQTQHHPASHHPDPFSEPAGQVPPPPKPPPPPPAPVEKTAEEIAREAEEKMARQESLRRKQAEREKQRELEEREAKERAAAKLRELEERLAKRASRTPEDQVNSSVKPSDRSADAEESAPLKPKSTPDLTTQPPTDDPPATASTEAPAHHDGGWQTSHTSEQEKPVTSGWQQQQEQWGPTSQAVPDSAPSALGAGLMGAPALLGSRAAVSDNPPNGQIGMWGLAGSQPGSAPPPGPTLQQPPQQPQSHPAQPHSQEPPGMMPSMSWGSQGLFGPGLFGPQTATDGSSEAQGVTDEDAKDHQPPPRDDLESSKGPQLGASHLSGKGVSALDAGIVGSKKGSSKKSAIGAPGGGKPGSSSNLAMMGGSEAPDAQPPAQAGGDPSSATGMAYNWGPDLGGDVIQSIQRRRDIKGGDPPASAAPARPESRQSGAEGATASESSATGVSAGSRHGGSGVDVITSDVFADGVSALPSDLALEPVPMIMDPHQMLAGMTAQQQQQAAAAAAQAAAQAAGQGSAAMGSYLHGMPMHQIAAGHNPYPSGATGFTAGLAPGRSGSPWQQAPPPPPRPLQQHPQHGGSGQGTVSSQQQRQQAPPQPPQQQGNGQAGRSDTTSPQPQMHPQQHPQLGGLPNQQASQGLDSFYGSAYGNGPLLSACGTTPWFWPPFTPPPHGPPQPLHSLWAVHSLCPIPWQPVWPAWGPWIFAQWQAARLEQRRCCCHLPPAPWDYAPWCNPVLAGHRSLLQHWAGGR